MTVTVRVGWEWQSVDGRAELKPTERAAIAASVQKTLEEYVVRLAGDAENVCLGGGVAWNDSTGRV